ncbi:MAG: hypothetical protein EOO38_20415 [Cytophagaceae bacterium]|nr:MAG: hypothetical protein EOO38_20415 [Cytophagaceae bacterium]
MRTIFRVVLCISIILVGCGCGKRTAGIKDVTKAEVLILRKKPAQGPIHRFDVTASADLQGVARIQLILNGAVYKEEVLKDRARVQWSSDWYSDEAEIRYIPLAVSKGSFALTYDFKD